MYFQVLVNSVFVGDEREIFDIYIYNSYIVRPDSYTSENTHLFSYYKLNLIYYCCINEPNRMLVCVLLEL